MSHYADPAPCLLCHRMIINAGITRVVGIMDDPDHVDCHKIIEMPINGDSLMMKIQQEYYDLLHTQEKEFEMLQEYHGEDMTPKELEDEHTRLSRIRRLIDMRQLMVEHREDEVSQDEALALMRELRGEPINAE